MIWLVEINNSKLKRPAIFSVYTLKCQISAREDPLHIGHYRWTPQGISFDLHTKKAKNQQKGCKSTRMSFVVANGLKFAAFGWFSLQTTHSDIKKGCWKVLFYNFWQQQLSWRSDNRLWLLPPLFSFAAKKWLTHVLTFCNSVSAHKKSTTKLTETIFVKVNLINLIRVALREVFQRENNGVATLLFIGRSCLYLNKVNFCHSINLADICLLSDDQNTTCLFQFSSRDTPRSLLGTRRRPGCYSWRRAHWRIWYSPIIPFGRFNVSCGPDCWWFYPVLHFLSKEKFKVSRKTSWRTHYGWFLKRFNEGKGEVCLKLWQEGEL